MLPSLTTVLYCVGYLFAFGFILFEVKKVMDHNRGK